MKTLRGIEKYMESKDYKDRLKTEYWQLKLTVPSAQKTPRRSTMR